ncbi:hypothetical protein Goshw_029429 [Gossypium schwendimanii]|uniref:Uncharacterized protein n=1 Tax=Gossypium schwendimanii TaxID=34291 RepID=A0A7J9N4F1_GOSSC|nr:hypothetical protein [Gossypium schwendimanii]
MSASMAKQLGNFIGSFIDYDVNKIRVWGNFLSASTYTRNARFAFRMGYFLRASSQRATPPTSIWLREEVPIGVPNIENSFGKIKGIRDNSLNSYPQNMANTNMDDKEIGYLQGKLTRLPNGSIIDVVGRNGGLLIGWKNTCTLSLWSFSERHIDVLIDDDSNGRTEVTNIREQLDREIANNLLWDLFQCFKNKHLVHLFSDRCPLLVDMGMNSFHSNWDVVLRKIVDAKFALNIEIDKEELFREQRARVLSQIAQNFLVSLFSSHGVANPVEILEGINNCITHDMNPKLIRDFYHEEVYATLKSMSPLKASSEGLSSLLKLASLSERLMGARIVRGTPLIMYLLFVNDSLLFGEGNASGGTKLKIFWANM